MRLWPTKGCSVVRPVSQSAIDRAGIAFSLVDLLPGGLTGLVIGDGGGEFFARFRRREGSGRSDPLDDYTRRVIPAALARAVGAGPGAFAVHFPFSRETPRLPIQRLGQVAGIPRPGPLGLQVHPRFGPWWAYRAFAVFPWSVPDEPALPSSCEGCSAPCVVACPGRAVNTAGFDFERCRSHRIVHEECQHACAARRACPVGSSEMYSDDQLAFHMAASFRHLRGRPPGELKAGGAGPGKRPRRARRSPRGPPR